MSMREQRPWMTRLAAMKMRFLLAFGYARLTVFSKDEILLARADKRIRRRLAFFQSLPMWIMMLIPLGIFIFSSNKAVLMVMILAILTIYTPLISLLGVCVAVKTGSHGANVRREYKRLVQVRLEGEITASAKPCRMGIAERAFERRSRYFGKVGVPELRTGRPTYVR